MSPTDVDSAEETVDTEATKVEAVSEKKKKPVGTQDSSAEDVKKAVEEAVKDIFEVQDAWKPKETIKFKIECPSGQTVLVKYLNTIDLVEYDLVEELDFFTRKLFPIDIDPNGNPVEQQEEMESGIWSAFRDPVKRCRFFEMTGRLIAAAALNPRVIHDGVAVVDVTDEDTGETKKVTKFGYQMSIEDQVRYLGRPIKPLPNSKYTYSGCIDFGDRMAFFQELNKPLGLIEPFREESVAVLSDMARSEGIGSTA